MKPYVICHMNSSVDGRILGSRWRPSENRMAGLFERIHEELGGGSWLIGRVTGSEYAKAQAYPSYTDQTYPREPWFARRDAKAYGIALDAQGKIAWGRSDIDGDPVVAVLTEQVSDAHLHRCFDAFGPEQMFWGTDITRMPCSWRQCLTVFTEELPWLNGRDPEHVIGEAVCNWVGWSRPA